MGRGTGPDWRGRVTAAACSCVRGGSGTTLTVIRAAVYTSTALAGILYRPGLYLIHARTRTSDVSKPVSASFGRPEFRFGRNRNRNRNSVGLYLQPIVPNFVTVELRRHPIPSFVKMRPRGLSGQRNEIHLIVYLSDSRAEQIQ